MGASAYRVLALGETAEAAFAPFDGIAARFPAFREATLWGLLGMVLPFLRYFDLTILDCLQGLQRARDLGWVRLWSFDVEAYRSLGQLHNGYMTWVVPGKFLALAAPAVAARETEDLRTLEKGDGTPDERAPIRGMITPEDCFAQVLQPAGVGLVVRLNMRPDRKDAIVVDLDTCEV